MDFEVLDALAAQWMKDRRSHLRREPGFVYDHGRRVAKGVITLRKQVTRDESHDDLLRVAAMFHDVGKGIEPHNVSGATLAREGLAELLSPDECAEVARLIRVHCQRDGSHDLWAHLLQDADLLDHFGTVEIWMAIQHQAYEGGSMADLSRYYQEDTGYSRHAGRWREELNFECSRRIYDEKHAFVLAFGRRLAVEASGEYEVPDA